MKYVLSWLMIVGLTVFCALWVGPGISRDFLRTNAIEATDAYAVTEADCDIDLFALQKCEIELTHRTTGAEHSFAYWMVGWFDGEDVTPMHDPATGYITTDVGVDNVWNRLLTMLGFIGLLGTVVLAPFWNHFRYGTFYHPKAAHLFE